MTEHENTPIYHGVVADQAWAPSMQQPPFNLDDFILNAKSKATAHVVLMRAADKEKIAFLRKQP